MPEAIDIGCVADFPVGLRAVRVAKRELVVLRSETGRWFAMASRCPHRGAPLVHGFYGCTFAPSPPGELALDADHLVIRCPWHGWEFDAETGRTVHGVSDRVLRVFPVEIEQDRVRVVIG